MTKPEKNIVVPVTVTHWHWVTDS